MIIQNNDIYIIEDNSFLFEENIHSNLPDKENYYISENHTFIFNDEKNSKIKKQIMKRLGEKSKLWTK